MKIAKSIFALLLSVCFIVLVICCTFIFSINYFFNGSNVKKILVETDLSSEVQKIRNSGSTENKSRYTLLIDDMYAMAFEYDIPESVMDRVIDSKTVKSILGDYLESLFKYIISGNKISDINEDDIYNLISSNIDDLLLETDFDVSSVQKEKFLNRVKMELPDIKSVIYELTEVINNKYQSKVSFLKFIFSGFFSFLLFFGLVFSIFGLFILKKESFMVYFSCSLMFAGLFIIGISLLLPLFIIDLMSQVDLSLFAGSFVDAFSKHALLLGILYIILSVFILIIYRIKNKRIFS